MKRRLIRMSEVAEGNATHLKIEMYYAMGGTNYFSSNVEKRGLYLSVSPVSRSASEDGKYVSESYTGFSGIKEHVLDMARFNQKKFDTYVVDETRLQVLIDYVLKNQNITLKETVIKRLEELRVEIQAERISQGEILELQSLAKYIEKGDVELLQWAGVEENSK
jgi:uncharacterized ubiquitin-like protein YukD